MSYLCPRFISAARNTYYNNTEAYTLYQGGKGAVLEVSLKNSDKREVRWFPVSDIVSQLTEPGLPQDATEVLSLALREIIKADLEAVSQVQAGPLRQSWQDFLVRKDIALSLDI